MDTIKAFLRPRVFIPSLIAVIALVVLIERLIVTDAERVNSMLDDAKTFSLEGRWGELIDMIDPDYEFEGMTREDFRKIVNENLKNKPLKHFQYFSREVEVKEGGQAVARVTLVLRAPQLNRPPPGMALMDDRFAGRFELGFRKREDLGWVISSIKIVQ
ncbi:MAG: hypothetical protein ACYTFG_11045 [Planctomycetota bacterium]|jgi:hypothetical protein